MVRTYLFITNIFRGVNLKYHIIQSLNFTNKVPHYALILW